MCFNKALNRFEVHFMGQKNNTYSFSVDGKLDGYVLKKTHLTQTKNAKKLFKQIEENNKKLEEQKNKDQLDRHMSDFKLMIDFANRHASDVDFGNNQKFLWF